MKPIFKYFPKLADNLPCLEIGTLPTPIEKLEGLSDCLKVNNLYIKRDDQSGPVYGGNKVRKLEFLFADALKSGAKRVITSGGAGSNHCLATALYARAVGLKAVLMVFAQPNAESVRQNLLMDLYSEAEIYHDNTFEEHRVHFDTMVKHYETIDGKAPYIIAPGGSSVVGSVGYVNAAFELKDQILAGEIPEPDEIYVALGTMGTASGLLLGLKAAGLKSKIIGVQVVPSFVANPEKFSTLYTSVNNLLHKYDSAFPIVNYSEEDFRIDFSYLGKGYGIYTEDSRAAVILAQQCDSIHLDGTYTGKAFAAFLDTVKATSNKKVRLFWDTKNSRIFPDEALNADYHKLPQDFYRYFEEPVQED